MRLKKLKNMFTKKIKSAFRGNQQEDKVDYSQLKKLMKKKETILIDVRSPQEYQEGHLDSAINIPFYEIANQIINKVPDKDTFLIVYCQSGHRSSKVAEELKELNYHNVWELEGGLDHIY